MPHVTANDGVKLYNRPCGEFMVRVEAGRREMRDPRAMTTAILSAPDK